MNETCTIVKIVSSYRSSVYAKKRQRKSKRVGVNVCQNVFRDELFVLVYADMKERKKEKRLSAREKVSFNKSLRKSVLWRVCVY